MISNSWKKIWKEKTPFFLFFQKTSENKELLLGNFRREIYFSLWLCVPLLLCFALYSRPGINLAKPDWQQAAVLDQIS